MDKILQNIEFARERQGEVGKGSNIRKIVYYTVGVCKDCGHTWRSDINSAADSNTNKKSNMWIWILGWICCFPIPITILIWRNEKWSKKLRYEMIAAMYAIIAAIWILMLIIGVLLGGLTNSDNKNNSTEAAIESTIEQTEATDGKEFNVEDYELKAEVADTLDFTVISVYGDSSDDFPEMLKIILDAAHAYGVKEDDIALSEFYNSNIGTEAGNNKVWEDAGIITSAPNEFENWYRADLYVNKK